MVPAKTMAELELEPVAEYFGQTAILGIMAYRPLELPTMQPKLKLLQKPSKKLMLRELRN